MIAGNVSGERKASGIGIVVMALCALFCVMFALPAHAFKVPDTGQKLCYDSASPFGEVSCAGSGQDGAYSINTPSFTVNADGTVTDNNTGLMWQQRDDGNTYNWWQANGISHTTHNPTISFVDVCGSLELGGYTDWRTPTFNELVTIVDYSLAQPGPTIDTSVFPETQQELYWSGNISATYGGTYAWGYHFYYGWARSAMYYKKDYYYVRCVRGEQVVQDLVDNGDGTVTDNKTGLMWQQEETDPLYWVAALSYCEELSLGGYSDWRLPTIKELVFLMDYSMDYPAANPVFFPGMPTDLCQYYGASTNRVTNPASHWNLSSCNGEVWSQSKIYNKTYVKCVRNTTSSTDRSVKTADPVVYYNYIQDAYDAVSSTQTILAQAVTLDESLNFAGGKTIILIGGYDSDWASNSGYTTISGLTVGGADKVAISYFIIK